MPGDLSSLAAYHAVVSGTIGRRRVAAISDRRRFAVASLLVNGTNGMRDIEGKVAREAMSKCRQRASFNISELAMTAA